MIIRDGRPQERAALEDLQRRASLMWDDARPYILENPDIIALALSHLADGYVRVAQMQGAALGFALVLPRGPGLCELDGLFVEPGHWNQGIGRALVRDALARIDAGVMEVVANPRAEGFYARLGFVRFATAQTPFGPAGRMRMAHFAPETGPNC